MAEPSVDVHAEHYRALGRMLVAFQLIEATLANGLLLLLNNKARPSSGPLAMCVVAELSFGAASRIAANIPRFISPTNINITTLESLATLQTELARCEDLLNRGLKLATAVEQRRNQLVHSHWFIDTRLKEPPLTVLRAKVKVRSRRSAMEYVPESAADIDACTRQAEEAQSLIVAALSGYHKVVNAKW